LSFAATSGVGKQKYVALREGCRRGRGGGRGRKGQLETFKNAGKSKFRTRRKGEVLSRPGRKTSKELRSEPAPQPNMQKDLLLFKEGAPEKKGKFHVTLRRGGGIPLREKGHIAAAQQEGKEGKRPPGQRGKDHHHSRAGPVAGRGKKVPSQSGPRGVDLLARREQQERTASSFERKGKGGKRFFCRSSSGGNRKKRKRTFGSIGHSV